MTTKIEGKEVQTRKGTPKKYAISGHKPGEASRLAGLFFGPPKTGKTTAANSGKDTLMLSFDPQGDTTKTITGRKDITVVEPESYKELDEIVRALHTTDSGRFGFVNVDSITFMFQMIGGREITDTYVNNKDMRRAYGKAGAATAQVISDLLKLKKEHVIFTAHLDKEQEEEPGVISMDQSLGETLVKVAVTPMVWKTLGPGVSFIGRTYKQTKNVRNEDGTRNKVTEYRVSFNDGERSPAGARIPLQGDYEITTDMLQRMADNL